MNNNYTLRLLKFCWPIIMGQLGQMLIGVGDVWVAGLENKNLLAAMSVANSLYSPCLLLGLGLLVAISPFLGRRQGEGHSIIGTLMPLTQYTIIISLVLTLVLICIILALPQMGFSPYLTHTMGRYLWVILPSLLPSLLFATAKEYLQTLGHTKLANTLTMISVLLNIFFNIIFVRYFGWGEVGLAMASLFCRWFMFLGLLPALRGHWGKQEGFSFYPIFQLGLPIALSFLLEVGAFAASTFMIGKISIDQVSAHQIVLTWASTAFMIPLAISSGLSTQVALAFGAKNYSEMKNWMKAGTRLSFCFMSFTAIIFYLIPHTLMSIFSLDPQVISIGTSFFLLAAFFQIFDGIQVTLSGCLRGLNETRPIFYAGVVAYWIIALPLGYVLAHHYGFLGQGLWIGLALGLLCAAFFLAFFLFKKLRPYST